jgi:hypothetical protein
MMIRPTVQRDVTPYSVRHIVPIAVFSGMNTPRQLMQLLSLNCTSFTTCHMTLPHIFKHYFFNTNFNIILPCSFCM